MLTSLGCDNAPNEGGPGNGEPPPPAACDDPLGCWKSLTPAPQKRQELQPAGLAGKIYLLGGLRGTSAANMEVLGSVDVYHPATDAWTSASPLPEARHHIAVAGHGGTLYAGGGFTGAGFASWEEHGQLWAYDPATDIWTDRTPMPTPRAEHLAITFGDKIYFIGGRTDFETDTGVNEVYHPTTDTWEEKAPMPTPRRSFAAVALDTLIYIVGGRRAVQGEPFEPVRLADLALVEAYAPASDRWHALASLPTPLGGLAVGALGGHLYALGGEFFSTSTGDVSRRNDRYDPRTNTWQAATAMPAPVHGTAAVTVADTLYVLAGATRAAVFSSDLAQAFILRTP